MFKIKAKLQNADPNASGGAPAPAASPNPIAPLAVDVQAEINKALAAQQADFAAQLEKATGHKDIAALTEAQLKAQGKLQELADAKTLEANSYKSKFEQTSIQNALLAATVDAVDPTLVASILAGKAVVGDNGAVSIDGKPVADAVKQLLADKPFLAKATGGTGSGAPQGTKPAPVNENLSPLQRLTAARQSV